MAYMLLLIAHLVSAAIYGEHTSATSDGRGVYGKSSGGAGIGYGVFGESGYVGTRGLASGSTYTGTAYAGYGTASGSTAAEPELVFTGLPVVLQQPKAIGEDISLQKYIPLKFALEPGGATGFIACIGGKLIAEEVRVELK